MGMFDAKMFGAQPLDLSMLKINPTVAAATQPQPRRRGLTGMLGGIGDALGGAVRGTVQAWTPSDGTRDPTVWDYVWGGQEHVDDVRGAQLQRLRMQALQTQMDREGEEYKQSMQQRGNWDAFVAQLPEGEQLRARAMGPQAYIAATAPPTPYQREEIQLGRDRLTEDRRYHDLTAANGGPNGFGRAPPGYAWNPDGTQRIIRGGPADQRFTQQQQRAARTALDALSNGNLVLDSLATARRQASGWTTGFVGSLLQGVPGSTAHDMQQTLATIRANIGFDKLAQMRANSPTGGALGNVSDRETALLQSVLGSLEQSQSQAQFLQNLDNLERTYRASMQRIREAYEQDFGGAQQQAAPAQGGGNQADPLGIR